MVKEVKTDRIFGTQNFHPICVHNKSLQPIKASNTGIDKFCDSNPKLNPAHQNPIYYLADEHLAKYAPSMLIGKYSNQGFLKEVMLKNSKVSESANEISGSKIFPQNISGEIIQHYIPTKNAALKIMKDCGEDFTKSDYENIRVAALLHDLGKVYIPDNIINKRGKLNASEKEIVSMHSDLGYEILRSGGMRGPTLKLVKAHHNYGQENPRLVQILQIADIWSALKQERPYKKSFSDATTFSILNERAQNGDFKKRYVAALAS